MRHNTVTATGVVYGPYTPLNARTRTNTSPAGNPNTDAPNPVADVRHTHVAPPSDDVCTGYPITGVPPSFNGANHDTSNTPATVDDATTSRTTNGATPPNTFTATGVVYGPYTPLNARTRTSTSPAGNPNTDAPNPVAEVRHTHVAPPSDDVCTGYATTGVPPSFNGANHDTSNTPATVEDATTSRTTNGAITTQHRSRQPVSCTARNTPFNARNRTYTSPAGNPDTDAPNPVADVRHTHVAPPSDDVCTGYAITGEPPSFNGANHDTSNTPATVEDATTSRTTNGAAPRQHVHRKPVSCTARDHTIQRTHPHLNTSPAGNPNTDAPNPVADVRHTHVAPPSDDVCTGYSITGVPPSSNGANHDTSNTPATVEDATTSRTTNGGSTTPASTVMNPDLVSTSLPAAFVAVNVTANTPSTG